MVITILAIVLGVIMTAGGVVPNVANGMLQNKLDQSLNHPEYLRVQVHPAAPSFSLLSGSIDYTEIDARNFVISDFPVESLQIRLDKVEANTDANPISLREPTQGVARLRVSEAGLNRFLKSDTFRQLIDELRKRQELAAQLDADLNELTLELQPDRLVFRGSAATMGGFFTIPFEIAGQLRLASERQLYVQNVQATTLDRPLSDDMIAAVLAALNPVLDLSKLSNDDMQLYFRELSVHDDYIELIGEAKLKKIPG